MATKEEMEAAAQQERAEQEQRNREAMERAARCRPTPTQMELDALRVGVMGIDDPKEPDGSA